MSSPLVRKIAIILKTYFDLVCKGISYIFEPLEMLIRGYSETAGEGIAQISTIIRNTIIVSPIILLSVAVGVVSTRSPVPDVSVLSGIEIQFLMSIIFGLSSVFAFIVMYISLEESFKDTVFTSGILLFTSVGFVSFSTPKVYAFLLIVSYGMGSYVIDRINLENPYPADYLDGELKITEGVIKNGIGFSVPVVVGIFGMTEYNPYLSENIFLGILLITTIISYSIPKSQRKYYANLYKHRSLNTSSQLWILSSKAGVLLSFSFALIDGRISILASIGMLTPLIVSILFATYMHLQKTDTIMGLTYKDSDRLSDPLYINSNKDVEVETNIGDNTADIKMSMSMSIPEELPKKSIAWQEFIKSTDKIYSLASDMSTADNLGNVRETEQELDEFYDNVAYQYYLQNQRKNRRIPVEGWSDKPIKRIVSQMYRCDNVNLQDVYDLDIRCGREEDDGIYINVED